MNYCDCPNCKTENCPAGEELADLKAQLEVPKSVRYFAETPVAKHVNRVLGEKLRKAEYEKAKLREAIQQAIESYEKIKWGYDGPCGTNFIMDRLHDALANYQSATNSPAISSSPKGLTENA